MATAQGILDAAAVTLPTGNLVDGCYDEVGNLYRLPEVVVSDPLNIIKRGEDGEDMRVERSRDDSTNNNNIDGETMIGIPVSKGAAGHEEKILDGGAESGVERQDSEMLERWRDDKGKGSERDAVKVRCRLSDRGGPDVVIALGKTQHVATLARRVQVEGNVSPFVLCPSSPAGYEPDSLSPSQGAIKKKVGLPIICITPNFLSRATRSDCDANIPILPIYTGLTHPPHPPRLPRQDAERKGHPRSPGLDRRARPQRHGRGRCRACA